MGLGGLSGLPPKKCGVVATGYVKAAARPLNNFPIVNILAAKTLNLQDMPTLHGVLMQFVISSAVRKQKTGAA